MVDVKAVHASTVRAIQAAALDLVQKLEGEVSQDQVAAEMLDAYSGALAGIFHEWYRSQPVEKFCEYVTERVIAISKQLVEVAKTKDWPKIDKFLSFDEIVEDVIKTKLMAEDIAYLRTLPADELIQLHHTLGRAVRNTYWLWHPENPHTATGVTMIDGVDHTENHPNSLSMKVLRKVHEVLVNGDPHSQSVA